MRMTRSVRTLLFAFTLFIMSAAASAQVRITVAFGPPAIPVYEQPLCPGDGYLWTPGYWAWDPDFTDYYWVPGTWVEAPEVGFLWTPPWWGWDGGVFLFHDGWWGPQVGFYGGINYGFGYFGLGFVGGRWQGNQFFYNREVLNVNVVSIHNVYNEHVTIVNNSHVAYNGGEGGLNARPTPAEEAAAQGRHIGPVAAQNEHIQQARSNPQLRASANQGRPPIAATARPADFHSAVPAREAGAPYHPPANRTAEAHPENPAPAHATAVHPNDLPPVEHPAAPNTGNAKLDQKYQKQQQKLVDQQNKERQKLQQQQDKEHAQLAQRNAGDAEKQQVEQKHAQQTQQMQQRHATQMQNLQARQAPHGGPR
jgi:WXXGXW repeat (2 copies)